MTRPEPDHTPPSVARVTSRLTELWRLPDQLNNIWRTLMAREDENYARLSATVENVKTGWASLVAERDEYKAALAGVDAEKAQAVADALAADSEHDADAIAQVEASLAELVPGQPVEVPADDAPPAGGDTPAGDVPADSPNTEV